MCRTLLANSHRGRLLSDQFTLLFLPSHFPSKRKRELMGLGVVSARFPQWESRSYGFISPNNPAGNAFRFHTGSAHHGKLTVAHISKEISKICWFFIQKGGKIQCEVTDKRRPLIEKGGLKVPCELTFSLSETVDNGETIFVKT